MVCFFFRHAWCDQGTNFFFFRTGTGAYKLGVNYAPGVMPQKEAAAKGYVQNLWLHGPEHYLTEVWDLIESSFSHSHSDIVGWNDEYVCRF